MPRLSIENSLAVYIGERQIDGFRRTKLQQQINPCDLDSLFHFFASFCGVGKGGNTIPFYLF